MPEKRVDFDYTTMSTYLTCQRKYYFRMARGITGKVPPTAADFGKAMHLALDEWYKSKDIDKAIYAFELSFTENPEDDKRTYKLAQWILRNYAEKYQDQPFQVLSTEREFRIPMGESFLTGRIDKIIEWDGAVWVMDHKTTSQLGPQYMKMHTPNLQFDGYTWAARKLGYNNCTGVLVDAILVAKGLLESSTRGRLTPLLRDFAYRSDEQLQHFEYIAQKVQSNIQLTDVTREYVPNFDACTYYGECPYHRICREPMDMWEEIIKQDYVDSTWSPAEGAKS